MTSLEEGLHIGNAMQAPLEGDQGAIDQEALEGDKKALVYELRL